MGAPLHHLTLVGLLASAGTILARSSIAPFAAMHKLVAILLLVLIASLLVSANPDFAWRLPDRWS